jgi:hypothetical protein
MGMGIERILQSLINKGTIATFCLVTKGGAFALIDGFLKQDNNGDYIVVKDGKEVITFDLNNVFTHSVQDYRTIIRIS